MAEGARTDLDLDRLLKLRLVVGRFGQMDGARWWNTNGMLGRQGALLIRRVLPRTHPFARARVVFTVAAARSRELFDLPGSMTLFALPAAVEDELDARWSHWLDHADSWGELFTRLESLPSSDLLETLRGFELIDDNVTDAVGKLRRSAEGRAVPLSGDRVPDDATVALLAAGFARGEPGRPAVPYAKLAS